MVEEKVQMSYYILPGRAISKLFREKQRCCSRDNVKATLNVYSITVKSAFMIAFEILDT